MSPVLADMEGLDLASMMAAMNIDEKSCRDVVESTLSAGGTRVADILGMQEYIRERALQWVREGGTWSPMPCVVSTIRLDASVRNMWRVCMCDALKSGGNYRGLWIDTLAFDDMWLAARNNEDALLFLVDQRVPMSSDFFSHVMTTSKYAHMVARFAMLVDDIDAVNDDFTYLMRAVAAGNVHNIEVCLNHGANINMEVDGCNALAYAFGPKFRADIYDLLVDHGATLSAGTLTQLRFRLDQLKLCGVPCSDLESRVLKCPKYIDEDEDLYCEPLTYLPIYSNDAY